MVLLKSEKIAMGAPAHDFSLVGTDDKTYTLSDFEGAKALVVVFMCNHCPYVQRIWHDLVDVQAKFMDRGVKFVGINPNFHPDYSEETMEKMKEYYEEYDMNFPYILDESQKVAEAYDAQCTPDIYVYDSDRKLAYHGRIEEGELAAAIEALLNDEKPSEDQNPSMGCSIKWRD